MEIGNENANMTKTKVRISGKVRSHAVSLLAQWAKDWRPVIYIASGLRYPGIISSISCNGVIAFAFHGPSGIDARILPSSWKMATIDTVGEMTSLHFKDIAAGEYSIALDLSRRSSITEEVAAREQVRKALKQLEKWRERHTNLFCFVGQDFGIQFTGRIASLCGEACVIEPLIPSYFEEDAKKQENTLHFMISLKGIHCSTNSTAPVEAVKLLNVELRLATGTRVRICEGELTPIGVFKEFLRDTGLTVQ
jgi:hypothetical protein